LGFIYDSEEAMSKLTAPVFQQLIAGISKDFTKDELESAIVVAFAESKVRGLIDTSGSLQIYLVNLLRTLSQYDGDAAILTLLVYLRDLKGSTVQAEMDKLIALFSDKAPSTATVKAPNAKCARLKEDQAALLTTYEALAKDHRFTTDTVNRVRMKRQLEDLEKQLGDLETEMKQLGCP
jgi:predicted type IV restriction endonuclease